MGQALPWKTRVYLIVVLGIYAEIQAKLVMRHLNVTHIVYHFTPFLIKGQGLVPYGFMHI
jgi:hypothetical protein